jgi:glutamyl-tRNA synthetase
MKRMPDAQLGQRLVPFLERAGLDPSGGPDPGAVAALLRDRAETLVAMADAAWYFYSTPLIPPEPLAEQITPANRAALLELHGEFATLAWTREALVAAIKAAAARHGLKPAQIMMPLRLLVAGTPSTPAIDAVLALLGRDTTRARMASGLGIAH